MIPVGFFRDLTHSGGRRAGRNLPSSSRRRVTEIPQGAAAADPFDLQREKTQGNGKSSKENGLHKMESRRKTKDTRGRGKGVHTGEEVQS
jgi:hypothetical protein